MAYYQQAELQKIGKEGFGIIDKCFGRPKRYGNKIIYQESEVPQMKESINKSNMQPSSNIAAQTYRVIYRSEVKYYYHG